MWLATLEARIHPVSDPHGGAPYLANLASKNGLSIQNRDISYIYSVLYTEWSV